jgi:hypothetical protein
MGRAPVRKRQGWRPLRDRRGFHVPLVLITNGSGLDREEMRRAQDVLAARGGTFWIKLDAETEAFYRAVCRTSVPFERILGNLTEAARRHPVVVQSMFFRWDGATPSGEEIAAYAARLAQVVAKGGWIALVQVYTVARETMEPGVASLSGEELGSIAEAARRAVPGVPVRYAASLRARHRGRTIFASPHQRLPDARAVRARRPAAGPAGGVSGSSMQVGENDALSEGAEGGAERVRIPYPLETHSR